MNPSGFAAPWRKFDHPDGRTWEVRVEGTHVLLKVVAADGELFERSRAYRDGDAAAREVAQMVEEQINDGFKEVSAPVWRAFLDQLVDHWKQDDPGFDAESLRDRILASTSPPAIEMVEHIMSLSDHWVEQRDGSAVLDLEHSLDNRDRNWLERHGRASMPALLLALRHPDNSAQIAIEAILGKLQAPEALLALVSVIDHPARNLAYHLGGRPQHFPTHALVQLGPPDPANTSRLVKALDHEDFRIAVAAAAVFAEFAGEDRFFKPLFAHVDRAKREDGFAWSIMRAAEVRRDPVLLPFLQWMQKSSRFRSAGYPERIREAIAGLGRLA